VTRRRKPRVPHWVRHAPTWHHDRRDRRLMTDELARAFGVRRVAYTKLATALDVVEERVREAIVALGLADARLPDSATLDEVERLASAIRQVVCDALPEVACVTCRGEGCPACHGRGWLSRVQLSPAKDDRSGEDDDRDEYGSRFDVEDA
jgi:hypothetical protein